MKVVIDAKKYRYSHLSQWGFQELIRRGMTCKTLTTSEEYKEKSADFYIDEIPVPKNQPDLLIKYLEKRKQEEPISWWAIEPNSKEFRTNPIYVKAVEELGAKLFDSDDASATVVEIPFDSLEGWWISEEEESGQEHIAEVHRTWWGKDAD